MPHLHNLFFFILLRVISVLQFFSMQKEESSGLEGCGNKLWRIKEQEDESGRKYAGFFFTDAQLRLSDELGLICNTTSLHRFNF